MSVKTFTQPNSATQTGAAYKAAIDHSIAAYLRLAGMFAPHQIEPTANMTVQVDAGCVFDGTALTERAQQTSGTITAPAVNPRRDIVYIDRASGAMGIATGAEAVSPADPALPVNKLPIARIALTVGQTSITNADLTDLRNLTHLGLSLAAATSIGIGPEQLVVNRNLGPLAYLTTLPHSMFDKGSAGDLLIHDADGYGARLGIGTTGQSLEISGGLPVWQTRTKVAQRVAAETGALDSTTTFIPNDDTIPQSGEGKQCTTLDVTITPKASGNKLVGEVILNVSGSTALVLIASVVKNGVASALTTGATMVYGNNELTQIKMSYEITAGSTSSQTFQVWFGSATNGQTMYINGANAARKFGGAYISSHKITEYWV